MSSKKILKSTICGVLLFCAILLAQNYEVINYTNNWGKEPLFNIAYSSNSEIEIIFSIHKLIVSETEIDGVRMKTFGMPGVFLPNDEGAPNLGSVSRFVAIPQGATAQVTIVDTRTEVYHNVEVAPAPNIPLETDKSPLRYVKNMAIYGRNAYYPDSPVRLSEPMQIRGVDCVILGITPFQYNPVTKELIVYKDIRVRIDFIGGNGHFGEDALRNIYWEPILQAHLLNYSSLPKIDFFSPERLLARDGYEYIIIVPDDPAFIAWAETIKVWRKLQGISTNVYTLTQVGGNTSTAIENFLNNAYNTWNPRPIGFLLLSDYPSSGDIYGITSPTWNNYCISDNMYADVNNDNLPDMFHGRITAQNESQLSIMIRKFLNYERTPPTDTAFYNHPLVACGWQDDRWFQLCAEVIRGFFINSLGKSPARQYNLGSPANPQVGGSWSTNSNTPIVVAYFGPSGLNYIPATNQYNSSWWNNGSAAGINAAINAGAFMVQHRDHGEVTGWGEPSYHNSDINGLTNDMLTFVNSHNCLTGKYNYSSECFAEKFHRHNISGVPKGAWGINAASEISYSFVNDCYAWGMFDCMWQQFMPDYPTTPTASLPYPSAGMVYGKIFLAGSSWPYNPSNKVHTYHLFHHHGDVFTPLYSETPQNLTVVHAPTLIAGATTFTISANDSAIIALTVNGEIIGKAIATGNPQAITIVPQIPGNNMIVTVTKPNYFRYQATVPVVSSSYPYIVAASTVMNDSNANGQVNPGELIDYGVWAKNIGIGTGQNIYGKMTTTDSFATIVRDSSWFGNIPQDDSVYSNPTYRFRVARNTPNNYQINFTFTFKDNADSTFRSYKSVRVYAPVIAFQNVAVVGGNNNGIFNRGETVDIVVTLKNQGGADAENVTANLIVTHPHITLLDGQGSFGTILPGNTANNSSDPFTVCSDTLIIPGTMVQFKVAV
ncbi:MAG: C25 family cysteine peptidase, partial [candidate division WOR-3 bacterium]